MQKVNFTFLNRLLIIAAIFIMMLHMQPALGQGMSISTSGNAADASALLDVNAAPGNNKGMLMPRVSLTSATDVTTIPAPATYLTVYNTNSSMTNGSGVGMYYYNGSKWVYMAAASNGPGATGQVLTSQGSNQSPMWITPPSPTGSGGGGGFCACFNNYQLFAGSVSSGSWTVPAGITVIKVQVWGAGGGGASANYGSFPYYGGGGGGAGGYSEGIFSVTAGNIFNVFVGAGGAGGANGGTNPGNDGGISSFVGTNVNIAATGGSGGGVPSSGSYATGGLGGMGTGGYFNSSLGNGGFGVYTGNSNNTIASNGTSGVGIGNGGGGGGGIGGGNGGAGFSGTAKAGQNAIVNSGAGGGGGYAGTTTTGGAGGNGADGMITVFW